MRRIISISSGKGGVGKTTFAMNYALNLSRFGRTILIDLDMGTSSIRNHLDVYVPYDLYHFFKKDKPLEECLIQLPQKYNPNNQFKNFAFIASPKGFFEDIVNLNYAYKLKLITAINKLQSDFIILDLRAGLDYRVLDFLPRANTGIVIFTPLVPAAVYAAAEIVVALVIRRLRKLFARNSPIYKNYSQRYYFLFKELLSRIEDVYDKSLENFDDFLNQLNEAIGPCTITHYVENVLHSFRAYYVLNQFNELEQSINKVVMPLTETIKKRVSKYVQLINLGWIVYDELIMESSSKKTPAILLKKSSLPKVDYSDDPFYRLECIRKAFMTKQSRGYKSFDIITSKEQKKTSLSLTIDKKIDPFLNSQLQMLKIMYNETNKEQDFKKNFDYITKHTLYLIKNYPYYSFGDKILTLSPPELDHE
mgnify:CR=1 FL=1